MRVQDHERKTALGQVVANRQTGLATADDHCLHPLVVVHATLPDASAKSTSPEGSARKNASGVSR